MGLWAAQLGIDCFRRLNPLPQIPHPDRLRPLSLVPHSLRLESFPILRRGARGEAVRGLQNRLRAIGVYQGEADGVFGAGTETAVKTAQRKFGLEADGVVGGANLGGSFTIDRFAENEKRQSDLAGCVVVNWKVCEIVHLILLLLVPAKLYNSVTRVLKGLTDQLDPCDR